MIAVDEVAEDGPREEDDKPQRHANGVPVKQGAAGGAEATSVHALPRHHKGEGEQAENDSGGPRDPF